MEKDLKKEVTKFGLLATGFLVFYFLPFGSQYVQDAIISGFTMLGSYAREHVLLCLVPAFFIAGTITVFIRKGLNIKTTGSRRPKDHFIPNRRRFWWNSGSLLVYDSSSFRRYLQTGRRSRTGSCLSLQRSGDKRCCDLSYWKRDRLGDGTCENRWGLDFSDCHWINYAEHLQREGIGRFCDSGIG